MVQVTKLAHVGFRAKNLSNQAEFYNDRWGLERIDEQSGDMFFRADDLVELVAGVEAVRDPYGNRDVKPILSS